jgi:hypothetical protein
MRQNQTNQIHLKKQTFLSSIFKKIFSELMWKKCNCLLEEILIYVVLIKLIPCPRCAHFTFSFGAGLFNPKIRREEFLAYKTPLNVITLGQTKSDNIKQIITTTGSFFLFFT